MRKSWYFNTVGTVAAALVVLPAAPLWAEPLTEAQAVAAQGLQRRLKAKIAVADGELAQLQVRLHSLKNDVLPAQRRAVTSAMPALAAA